MSNEPKNWKPAQRDAINRREGEVIVSASAGTGKTSVLIERAWQIVAAELANVDELLIVTFTDAAAEELKTRFRNRLDAEIVQTVRPETRDFLRRQLHRLDRTQISTIHSLCLRIVRENYHRLGISDDVDILPPQQADLLKSRILDDLFELFYGQSDAAGMRFREFVERYGGRRVDAGVALIILKIHAFLGSIAQPERWLNQARAMASELRTPELDLTRLAAWQYMKHRWLTSFNDICREFEKYRDQITPQCNEKLDRYMIELIELVHRYRKLLDADRNTDMLAELETALPRSPQIRKEEEKIWWTPVKEQLDAAKDRIKEIAKEFAQALHPDMKNRLAAQADLLDTLLNLVDLFTQRLTAAKQARGQMEYDDLQRFALRVLDDPEITETYRRQFRFVMVDEYQDVNELQDTIIRRLCRPDANFSDRCSNLFMVGDVKQSIYRFRQAEPEIFQRLYRIAKPGNSRGLHRIDLADNFRSRREVIDLVNAIFTPLLTGGEVELEYDRPSQLVCGADFTPPDFDAKPEFHFLERKIEVFDDSSEEENELAEMEFTAREASLAARRIRELLESKMPVSLNRGTKTVEPEDIVILLRNLRNVAGTYITTLRRMGLNAYCEQIEAFLEFPEITDIVSLLRIIDNPFHDIPLATVLRSPLVGATINELAQIRLSDSGPLYQALLKFVNDAPLNPASQKLSSFLDRYERWRRTAGCCSVAELVQRIYLETGYPHYVRAALPGLHGEENLDQFFQLALSFSADGRSDLTDFLEYLDLLAQRSAPVSSTQNCLGSGIRIMSVHAAKGLEFPVVILGNLGRKINLTEIRGDFLIDRDLIIGMKEVDPRRLTRASTLPFLALADKTRNKSVAEELRLLYVAMTRAREKLILIGGDKSENLAKNIGQIVPNGKLPPSQVANRQSPLQWICAALAASPKGQTDLIQTLRSDRKIQTSFETLNFIFHPPLAQARWVNERTSPEKQVTQASTPLAELASSSQTSDAPTAVQKSVDKLLAILDWQYPHRQLCTMPTHFSVTELTQRADTADQAAATDDFSLGVSGNLFDSTSIRLPNAENRSAIDRGLAWHTFLQHLDLSQPMDADNIHRQMESLVKQQTLSAAQAQMVDPAKVERFFTTQPGRLMLEYRDRVYRELPFTFALPAGSLPDHLRPAEVHEPVIIQGIIDCLIGTPDGLVIVDYKTNNITAGDVDRMTDHYRTQVVLYTRAVTEIVKTRLASAWLYFSEPDSAVQVL